MTSFATAQELRTLMTGETLDEEADAEWIAQAEALLELVSGDIQTAARNRIVAGEETALLAGTWNRDLELPRRPVVSVTSVVLNGQTLAPATFEWNDRQLLRRYHDFGRYFDADHLAPSDGAHWGGPASAVAVTYAYGYDSDEVPSFVKSLTLRAAARNIGNAAQITQESLGPYSVTYAARTAEDGSYLTNREVRMLRRRFSRTGGTLPARSL